MTHGVDICNNVNLDPEMCLRRGEGVSITKTCLCITAIFHGCKADNFQMKKCDICLIFAHNIYRGYTLEPVLTSTHDLCFRAKKWIPM